MELFHQPLTNLLLPCFVSVLFSNMKSSTLFTCLFALLLLLVQPGVSDIGDILGPIISPIIDDVCKVVDCGKGHCRPSATGLSFVCECDVGWRQAMTPQDIADDVLKLMPCVVPNCTLNFSCGSTPSLTQPKTNTSIGSIFDPCNWAVCGDGTCQKTSAFTHDCICKDGYLNLLNITSFPCLKQCSIGMDCAQLGIPIVDNTPPADPFSPDSSGNDILDKSVIFLGITLMIYSSLMILH